jgi:hypothetical protein
LGERERGWGIYLADFWRAFISWAAVISHLRLCFEVFDGDLEVFDGDLEVFDGDFEVFDGDFEVFDGDSEVFDGDQRDASAHVRHLAQRVPSLPPCLRLSEQDLSIFRTTSQFPSSLMPLMSHDLPSQTTPPASSMSKPVGLFHSQT